MAARSVCWRSGRSRAPTVEEWEALGQPLVELRQAEQAEPRGGKLDGQRQAVEAFADRRDQRPRLESDVELGLDRPSTFEEESHRRRDLVLQSIGCAHSKRRHAVLMFAADAQRSSAGGQHPKFVGGAEELGHRSRCGGQELLQIVEHQQGVPGRQVLGQRHPDRLVGLLAQADGSGDGARYQLGVTYWGEVHEEDTLWERFELLSCHLQCQARLADAPRSQQGDEAMRCQQSAQLGHLSFAPDETRQLHRQVVGMGVEAFQCGKLGAQLRVVELVHVLRLAQVLETVRGQVAQRGTCRQRIGS